MKYAVRINYQTETSCNTFATEIEAKDEDTTITEATKLLRADKRRRVMKVDGGDVEAVKTIYRLGSSSFVHAPGLVAWAINGAKFPRDRKTVANIIAKTWGIPMPVATALVTEKAAFTIDGMTVVFAA